MRRAIRLIAGLSFVTLLGACAGNSVNAQETNPRQQETNPRQQETNPRQQETNPRQQETNPRHQETNTHQPAVQVTRQPAVQVTRQPWVQVTRQPWVQVTRQPWVQVTRQPAVQVTRQPAVQVTRQPAVQVTRGWQSGIDPTEAAIEYEMDLAINLARERFQDVDMDVGARGLDVRQKESQLPGSGDTDVDARLREVPDARVTGEKQAKKNPPKPFGDAPVMDPFAKKKSPKP